MIRAMVMAGGIAGAAGMSQFPEYSQQYTQRLAGAVDELSRVVDDFDSSAAAVGLDRAGALSQMTGTAFVERRRTDMERTFTRHARLSADLEALRGAGPFSRAYRAAHLTDPEIARRAWGDFRPALPLTFEGLAFAGLGFVMGWVVILVLASILRLGFARSRRSVA